jgi:hypothetical protein
LGVHSGVKLSVSLYFFFIRKAESLNLRVLNKLFMKNNYLLLIIFLPIFSLAQVGIGTTNPQGTLDIATDSTTNPINADGLLIPRVALSNTTTATVITPTISEMVYNTATAGDVTPGYYSWDGAKWIRFTTSEEKDKWSLTGNTATNPTTNFIGTTDATDFVARTNNSERLRITNNGVIGINAPIPGSLGGDLNSPRLELRSESGSASDVNISLFGGNLGTYAALNFARSRGTQAAPTILINQDTLFRFDGLGYNGSSFVNMGGMSLLVNGTPSATSMPSSLQFFTVPNGSLTRAARMTITNSGNVGIGTPIPNAQLQFANNGSNRKIVLYESINNDHQFYGFGLNANMLRFQTDATVSDHAFFAGTSSTTSNELMRIKGTGDVGIGTSTPNYKLDVAGNLRTTTDAYFATTNGRVGIGTTTPYGLAKLEVNAASSLFRVFDFPLVTNSMVLAAEFTGKNNSGALVRFAGPTTRYMDLGQDATGNFTIRRNDLDAFLIDTFTGNIGIGTPTPVAKLDILGTIKITDGTQGLGKILTSDANGNASWNFNSTPLLKTYEATLPIVNPLNASVTGSIIYSQTSGNPLFPEDLPDGFTCTIVNYSNFPLTSNTLTTAVFVTEASGNIGISSFTIQPGGSVNVFVVTIPSPLQKRYYIK